jgi:hypothetical protein
MTNPIYPRATSHSEDVRCEEVALDGERFHKMENYDRLRPFLMSVVSDGDHWMFISSTGALTAGRRNPDGALFPYYTEDKIHDSAGITGSRTVCAVSRGGRVSIWEPFRICGSGSHRIRRNLYKSVWGNQVVFEEINENLSVAFRYGWYSSAKFGWVRRAWLENRGGDECRITVTDGLQNLMASGVGSQFQLEKGNLLDAYRRSEKSRGSTLAVYSYSSIPVDRPEPSESLKATVVWSLGPGKPRISLSQGIFDTPCGGPDNLFHDEVRGERGVYALRAGARLVPGQKAGWLIAADVDCSHSRIANLAPLLRSGAPIRRMVLGDIERGTMELRRMVASADGAQQSAFPRSDTRHFANALFNIMRGGVFRDGYAVESADFARAVLRADRIVARRQKRWLSRLPGELTYRELVQRAMEVGDRHLERIAREYLPLTFSRRHGDPSRPWNRFNIPSLNPDGSRALDYEGNWRDIFQNWEALATAFPDYIQGMICRFVNASTADGYNPYRITRGGLDWEVVDPHDPWSFIGYWGDHQIIYLLKLLELLESHDPAALRSLLTREIFSFANVPYRIRDYASLLRDPRQTVTFDTEADKAARLRADVTGSDGLLFFNRTGEVHLTNLAEKLLIPILTKLSNFIPEAGIWLNTQRPEWNDANNALVGNGVSMVTLCHLRRHFVFLAGIFESVGGQKFSLAGEVATFLGNIERALLSARKDFGIGSRAPRASRDAARRRVLDALGKAGATYRAGIYGSGFTRSRLFVTAESAAAFLRLGVQWMDQSIRANKRKDGLYESYNLVRFEKAGVSIRRLYPMLEGQVAVLTSGILAPEESVRMLRALRSSSLYRKDQRSYLLYPDRKLTPFILKNNIPGAEVRRSGLLTRLLREENRELIERDSLGGVHFVSSFRNGADVRKRLDELAERGFRRVVAKEGEGAVRLFERLFEHESFTGRSGSFFAYEGLGSIYWHMVSKLLLAVRETFLDAVAGGAGEPVTRGLARFYYDVRAGLGDTKTPAQYGAFPSDPYSHTPAHKGATQPGLTGQVKEGILCRRGELGLRVVAGRLAFDPLLLRRSEFVARTQRFDFFDIRGSLRSVTLPRGALAFTCCQTPVVYHITDHPGIRVLYADGVAKESDGRVLDKQDSDDIFGRTGKIERVEVGIRESSLWSE